MSSGRLGGGAGSDPTAADDAPFVVVEHSGLARGGGPGLHIEQHAPATVLAGLDAPGHRLSPMSDADTGGEACAGRLVDERDVRDVEAPPVEVLSSTERDQVLSAIDGGDVLALAERDAQPAALADGVGSRAGMLADRGAVGVDQRAGLRLPVGALAAARRGSRLRARSRSPGSRACRPWPARGDAPARAPAAWSAHPAGSACAPAGPGRGRRGSSSGPCRRRRPASSR